MRLSTLPSSLVSLVEHAIEDERLRGVVGVDREVLHNVLLTKWGWVIILDGLFFNSRLKKICVVSQRLIGSHVLFLDGVMSLLRRDCMTRSRAWALRPLWIVIELLILRLLLCQTLRLVVIVITPHLRLVVLRAILELLHSVLYTCILLILRLCLKLPRLLDIVLLTTTTTLLLFCHLSFLLLPLNLG